MARRRLLWSKEAKGNKFLGKVIHVGKLGVEAGGNRMEMVVLAATDAWEDLRR